MNTTLQNNHTKFRAKIFKPCRVITFLVLGHFFSRTLYYPIDIIYLQWNWDHIPLAFVIALHRCSMNRVAVGYPGN